eukprot:m.91418 g.91418  ORF g.91418 m.91418 type:complete len:180 (+) comp13302_c0_seq1:268-807(+)
MDTLKGKKSKNCSPIVGTISDGIAQHTFRAVGYDEKSITTKARLGGNKYRNHSRDIVESTNGMEFVDWKTIESHDAYVRAHAEIYDLFKQNSAFQAEVKQVTGSILEQRIKPNVDLEEAVLEGTNYLLKEFAFLSASPEIYSVPQINFVYHREWPIYERFIEGAYNGVARKDLGFFIVK